MEVEHRIEPLDLKLPFWRYLEAFRDEPYSFLLDSALHPHPHSQCSFLGAGPRLVYTAKRIPSHLEHQEANVTILRRRAVESSPPSFDKEERRVADVFQDLSNLFSELEISPDAYRSSPLPWLSGAVGYFGYECNYFIEKLPDEGKDDLQLPEIGLLFVEWLLGHDHGTGKTYLSVAGRGATRAKAQERVDRLLSCVNERVSRFEMSPLSEWTQPPGSFSHARLDLKAHAGEAEYMQVVREAQEQIRAGACSQVCTTHRLQAPFAGDGWELYRELRRVNPAPFGCYLKFPWAEVISSSPERFLRLGPDRTVESRPIKGTRPRGRTPDEDEQNRRELAASVKDQAENTMIVDLVRNDLGRVCDIGSVHVSELRIIETHPTVFQMVSTIRGKLRTDRTMLDLFRSAFPGGSMTGAPKIQAMKIIDALEPYKRGIYSGAIGCLDPSGRFDFSIAIRTAVLKDKQVYFSVGGAVVSDSDPRGEYLESMDKAKAIVRALENVIHKL